MLVLTLQRCRAEPRVRSCRHQSRVAQRGQYCNARRAVRPAQSCPQSVGCRARGLVHTAMRAWLRDPPKQLNEHHTKPACALRHDRPALHGNEPDHLHRKVGPTRYFCAPRSWRFSSHDTLRTRPPVTGPTRAVARAPGRRGCAHRRACLAAAWRRLTRAAARGRAVAADNRVSRRASSLASSVSRGVSSWSDRGAACSRDGGRAGVRGACGAELSELSRAL